MEKISDRKNNMITPGFQRADGMVEICVLASGSRGNCIYVSDGNEGFLIDAGLSRKEFLKRFHEKGLSGGPVNAILVTHEHSDHIKGLVPISDFFGCPVLANELTAGEIRKITGAAACLDTYRNGEEVKLGGFKINPFPISHDAVDPVGYEVFHKHGKICVVTDIGYPSGLVKEKLKGSNIIVIEANHEEALVFNGTRPWEIKQRIVSRKGHLSNNDLALLLREIADDKLQFIFLAHLSRDHNVPEKAEELIKGVLSDKILNDTDIILTWQDRPTDVYRISDSRKIEKEKTLSA
ncbi:MAG: MBL fold metallo-hydrolase [Candidatus Aureabacteria bacterium]|nr:MBL fold metallo-hydrolase [Candidatus Auribacterota bacterium]